MVGDGAVRAGGGGEIVAVVGDGAVCAGGGGEIVAVVGRRYTDAKGFGGEMVHHVREGVWVLTVVE